MIQSKHQNQMFSNTASPVFNPSKYERIPPIEVAKHAPARVTTGPAGISDTDGRAGIIRMMQVATLI